MEILEGQSLKSLNTWKVGGEAQYLCFPKSIEDIQFALKFAEDRNISYTVLSGGSNVLISDEGIRGLCICLKKFTGKEVSINNNILCITANAGESKSSLLKTFLKYKLPPALMMAGLPGDTGGGVFMNAGVSEALQPREFCEIVEKIKVINVDGVVEIAGKDLKWSYRHCDGWQPGVIAETSFVWPMKDVDEGIGEKVRELNRIRLNKQPLDKPSCGSVFVNPKPHSAGKLIEQAGLKAYKIGGAEVSQKHANFIINVGDAKAQDIYQLICFVQKRIKEKFSIDLKTEVRFLGEWKI